MKTHYNKYDDDDVSYIIGGHAGKPFYKKWWFYALVTLGIVAAVIVYKLATRNHNDASPKLIITTENLSTNAVGRNPKFQSDSAQPGKVIVSEATVNGKTLKIWQFDGGYAELRIGAVGTDDPDVIFATQAADIRSDNRGIVGAFVNRGELVSKGQAKKGFCAIIDGKVVVGAAEHSPYLEEAIEKGGYFFRQYPLVYDGLVIDNKPKGTALRRALCERDGEIIVVECNAITFHDFAQTLADFGVQNAIYLVGADAYGFHKADDGLAIEHGDPKWNQEPNVTYLVWKR
ncbi:MAG: phosphodiester glycosidase family protein [Bacteroidales bacterium]|nr:phosphodiester glycosidase family protein [Bacteroidales bacterium]